MQESLKPLHRNLLKAKGDSGKIFAPVKSKAACIVLRQHFAKAVKGLQVCAGRVAVVVDIVLEDAVHLGYLASSILAGKKAMLC
ncbi:hypothetical protein, partial [Sporisorium scitamineum]